MRIHWEDGVEHSPGGPAREVCQPSVWNSSVWITADGQGFRRYYNSQSKRWVWAEMSVAFDREQFRLGYTLPMGWTSIEGCIASAFLHRAPGSRARVKILEERDVNVANLVWGEPEFDTESGDFAGEQWYALRWDCGIAACDKRYHISSHGRLKSPYSGKVTRGFAAHGSQWAAVRNAGLVNLQAAAGLVRADVKVQPRIYHAYRAIVSGTPIADHARRFGISQTLAWDYCNRAAPLVPDRHVYGKPYVSPDLWRLLQALRGSPVLGGRLLELQAVCSRRLGRDVAWDELRMGRTCVV